MFKFQQDILSHCSSDNSNIGKESGDPSSVPELGRSLGEGIGYPL